MLIYFPGSRLKLLGLLGPKQTRGGGIALEVVQMQQRAEVPVMPEGTQRCEILDLTALNTWFSTTIFISLVGCTESFLLVSCLTDRENERNWA